jgi:hypothetical protein
MQRAISGRHKGPYIICVLTIILMFLIPCSASFAQQDKYWIGGTGGWDDDANWSPTGQPAVGDSAYINNSSGSNIDIWYRNNLKPNPNASLQELSFTASAGRTTFYLGSTGSDETLHSWDVILNGSTVFIQADGYLSAFGLSISNGGGYSLRGGNLYTDYPIIGSPINGVGTGGGFEQLGGNHSPLITYIGYGYGGSGIGQYTMMGGVLSSRDAIYVGIGDIQGVFNQYNNSIVATMDLIVGGRQSNLDKGTGTYAQHDGLTTVGGSLTLGDTATGTGNYYMLAGKINAAKVTVGNYGTGYFTQSGGDVLTDILKISAQHNSRGKYDISGGTLTAGSIYNWDRLIYRGGLINSSYIENNRYISLTGTGTRTLNGTIVNNGTFEVTGTNAVFTGSFTNNGTYTSDPSKNYFQNLYNYGLMKGGQGDEFHISNNFMNYGSLDTALADLYFDGTGPHTFLIGDSGSWDDMILDFGATLILQGVGILHVNTLHVYSLDQIPNLGLISYTNLDIVPTPEPTTALLFGFGIIGLAGARRLRQ